MTVRAIHNNYQFEPLDLQKNYGDQFLLYVGWDHHTLFARHMPCLPRLNKLLNS